MLNLAKKTAIVSGGSKGIGKAIAMKLAQAGANVVICSRRKENLDSAVNEAESNGLTFIPIECNTSNKESIQSVVDHTIEKFDKVMHNNIRSNQVLCNLVLPEMISKEDGSIIIISSIAAIKGSPILGAYNISKAADVMIVKNIAAEFGHKNIRANSIAPGLIKTDFAKALWENPDILKTVLSSTPMQRIGMPDEVAGVAVMLASNAGNYINGQTIVVDGGTTIT